VYSQVPRAGSVSPRRRIHAAADVRDFVTDLTVREFAADLDFINSDPT